MLANNSVAFFPGEPVFKVHVLAESVERHQHFDQRLHTYWLPILHAKMGKQKRYTPIVFLPCNVANQAFLVVCLNQVANVLRVQSHGPDHENFFAYRQFAEVDFIEPAFQVHFRSDVLVEELGRVGHQKNSLGVRDRGQTVKAVSEDNLVSQGVCVAAHAIKLKHDCLAAVFGIKHSQHALLWGLYIWNGYQL